MEKEFNSSEPDLYSLLEPPSMADAGNRTSLRSAPWTLPSTVSGSVDGSLLAQRLSLGGVPRAGRDLGESPASTPLRRGSPLLLSGGGEIQGVQIS